MIRAFVILCVLTAGVVACKKESAKSGEKSILSFTAGGRTWCDGNCGDVISQEFCKTATVNVESAKIVVSDKAVVRLKSGSDFFSDEGVIYTVTAEDGSIAAYTVKATRSMNKCE